LGTFGFQFFYNYSFDYDILLTSNKGGVMSEDKIDTLAKVAANMIINSSRFRNDPLVEGKKEAKIFEAVKDALIEAISKLQTN